MNFAMELVVSLVLVAVGGAMEAGLIYLATKVCTARCERNAEHRDP
jgi:hypothetical protein